ncbi:hypothetical protein [Alicyclobacillus acidiphilus]|uniref:hypothetical protein n=1 Tax=Alicyclobacillus acidiphilus TaxID=182455 RepID=UPI0008353C4C|nr:hypothetical protein [Alicyclobacillus acidiphilus]
MNESSQRIVIHAAYGRYTNILVFPVLIAATAIPLMHHHTFIGGLIVGCASSVIIFFVMHAIWQEIRFLSDGIQFSSKFYDIHDIEEIKLSQRKFTIVTTTGDQARMHLWEDRDSIKRAILGWAQQHHIHVVNE